MSTKLIVILGESHLAKRVSNLIVEKGYRVNHIPDLLANSNTPGRPSIIDEMETAFKQIEFRDAHFVYILNERDEQNLEMVVALMAIRPDLNVCTSLFNEQIRPHLERANARMHIINPAKIAAPVFVDALDYPIAREHQTNYPATAFIPPKTKDEDTFLKVLIAAFVTVNALAITYFHFQENLDWIDAVYFDVVTVATVGYGDINLLASPAISKLVGIGLILSSTFFIWIIFSLTIDRIIKTRVQRALGRKTYHLKNHIILCGLGRLGYYIAEELSRRGEKVVIIESNESSNSIGYFRAKGLDVYAGNARIPHVLREAGATNCRGLISVINDDYANLEIGLSARSIQPNVRLILRIFDANMAGVIKDKFDIHLTESMSLIAGDYCAAIVDKEFA